MTVIDRSKKAPFPWFGGKSSVAAEIWQRLGSPKQYIEPFCGSAAMLLAAPAPASLEVIGDANCYVANFWRALKHQPDAVTVWQDYPVSHIDLYARHRWLTEPARVSDLRAKLTDADWPGDAKIAGWWLWGQCCWIGSGWCDPDRGQRGEGSAGDDGCGQIPHAGNAGRGVQATTLGKIPHAGNAGRGVQATTLGKIPHLADAGLGVMKSSLAGHGQIPFMSSSGMGAQGMVREWMHALATRLERVRIVHGDWSRCLNHHYGGNDTAVFLDPPYLAFEKLYSGAEAKEPCAAQVAAWARDHQHLRVVLCGHRGDYDMPGWSTLDWSRGRLTYGGAKTTDAECLWFSPACHAAGQRDLFAAVAP